MDGAVSLGVIEGAGSERHHHSFHEHAFICIWRPNMYRCSSRRWRHKVRIHGLAEGHYHTWRFWQLLRSFETVISAQTAGENRVLAFPFRNPTIILMKGVLL